MSFMFTSSFAFALAAGIIPSFIWLFFWTREDRLHPEPKSLLAACFIVGMIATITAIPIEQWVANFADTTNTRYILWAAVEEILKLLMVAAVALRTRSNDEPIDAMIYFITLALGFAALENALFIMGPLSLGNVMSSFVTGMATFQNRVQSSLSGGSDFVGKPFSIPELGLKALIWVFKGQLGQT